MNFTGVTKLVASGLVGIGTSKIVKGIIKDHVTPEKLFDKITIVMATSALSAVVAKETKKYTDETIDGIATYLTAVFDGLSQAEETVENIKEEMKTKSEPETKIIDSEVTSDENPAKAA
jgi:ATP phosphoribosyltransferase regulatory subunit HisZ